MTNLAGVIKTNWSKLPGNTTAIILTNLKSRRIGGTDINSLQSSVQERTGYPTQKPLALYERIIKASSNPGDMVIDPFAGCATTCVAAERLGRQWVGIDIWEGAHGLVLDRLRSETQASMAWNDTVGLFHGPADTDRRRP